MALVITNIGKQKALEYITGKDTSTETLIMKLYSNDVTPSSQDILSAYTEVSVANGYTSISLTGSNWTVSDGAASYPQQTWTFTGSAGTVYGYYLVSATNNQLYFAERFPNAPYTISNNGDIIRVTLNLTLT